MISRREFVHGTALAGAAGLLGIGRNGYAAEPPPETRRIRLGKAPSACLAPQYIAEELLRAEGFQQIEYVGTGQGSAGLARARAVRDST